MDCIIKLNEEETKKCQEVAAAPGRDKSELWLESVYRKGFLGPAATLMGVTSEFAFSKVFFGKGINETVSFIGDGGSDFNEYGVKIDTKCQRYESQRAIDNGYYGGFYVSATDKNNNERNMKYDMVFFMTIEALGYPGAFQNVYTSIVAKDNILGPKHNLYEKITTIDFALCGYIWKKDIEKNKEERKFPTLRYSPDGNSYNYYIKREELIMPSSVDSFISVLKSRKVSV